ncbi:MAG TPA: hypothetical protein VKV26_07855 [Dehalococcoidia bacterium]|nr:hypothetical protein [Dehalococcoidia bacterium]
MSDEPRARSWAVAALPQRRDGGIELGPLGLSGARLRRARRRAKADAESARTFLRDTVARARGRHAPATAAADAAAKWSPAQLTTSVRRLKQNTLARLKPVKRPDHRPDGSAVSPPLPPPVQRAPEPGRNGAHSPLAVLRERWRDAVREGKLAARERETEIRAEYERRVRHDARLHAQHRGLLPPRAAGDQDDA